MGNQTMGERISTLRKARGMTQEELAGQLYVSRTAISKWESDRGYPNIESIKAIAAFFSLTVDELLSTDEALTIAKEQQKQTEKHLRDLVFGLLDICMSLLLFLPLLANKANGLIEATSLLTLHGVGTYLKPAYFAVVIATVLTGILTLSLQACTARAWVKIKTGISLTLGIFAVLLFTVSQQPYAAVFAFSLLAFKTVMLFKHK